jgi:hypothetical protein
MQVRRRATSTGWHGAPPQAARLQQRVRACIVWVTLLCAGWYPYVSALFGGYGPSPVQDQSADTRSALRQRQVAFLHRIRQADPRYQTINKAVRNAQNELGVIPHRHVDMEAVRPLMRTLLTQMAKAFPGHNLTVIAYAPNPAAPASGDRQIQRTHAADDVHPCRAPVNPTQGERKYHAWNSGRFHVTV